MKFSLKSVTWPFVAPKPGSISRTSLSLRVLAWGLLIAAMVIPIIQLERKTLKNDQKYQAWMARYDAGQLTPVEIKAGPPKGHKGAVNRWRRAIQAFWEGENIYQTPEEYIRNDSGGKREPDETAICLHPNMPFVVILLSPFALLPIAWGGLVFSILKVLAVLGAGLCTMAVVNHKSHRMPDWLAGLGVAWWITLFISDIQHANTNGFVLAFIALQLWMFRKKHDGLAGASLAAAICLKMTPVLFVLYWAYQRRWKVLRGAVAAGVFFVVVVPAVAVGPQRAYHLTETWLNNLIFKGVGGSWYPVHVNQSLHGTASRYLMDGQPGGDINWNPDDHPDYAVYKELYKTPGLEKYQPEWIALASLSEPAVKWIIRGLQLAIVMVMAWAIGFRQRDRDDGRLALHYAMILSAMLLLNQRSWGHHAAILLPATLAVWYAIAFGRVGSAVRGLTLGFMLLGGLLLWGGAGESLKGIGKLLGAEDPDIFANRMDAYGPVCLYFLLIFAAAAILSFALKHKTDPYAQQRQKLLAPK